MRLRVWLPLCGTVGLIILSKTQGGNELTLSSSGNTCPQSSQLTEPLWSLASSVWYSWINHSEQNSGWKRAYT